MVIVEFLKFPYPFKTAITISNDADLSNWQSFKEIYNFFNSDKNTIFGQGLGLSISTSVFFYSIDGKSLSFFEGLANKKSSYANVLIDLMKEGVIDTLHSYGDWGTYTNLNMNSYSFNRKNAEYVIEELYKNNIKLRVWTNHGHANSIQNISYSGLKRTYEEGDNPNSSVYHVDLLDRYGIKFFWAESTNVIGQDVSFAPFVCKLLKSPRFVRFFSKETLKAQIKTQNKLLKEQLCLDKNRRIFFLRYRGKHKTIVNSIRFQLSSDIVDFLISLGGYFILYTHFGVREVGGKLCTNTPAWLPKEFIESMYYLKEKNEEKQVWIAPLVDLLTYNYIINFINIEHEIFNKMSIVRITLKEKERYLERYLGGLSVKIKGQGHEKIKALYVNDKDISLNLVHSNRDSSIYQVPLARHNFAIS